MTRFFIIRHGETRGTKVRRYFGSTDMQLSRKGIMQAHGLRKRLEKEKIDCIYTSHQRRCRKTAEIIKGKRKIKTMIAPDIRELDFGEWEGLDIREINKKDPRKVKRWHNDFMNFRMPGGEKITNMISRTERFWKYVTSRHKDQNIFIVTHGGPARIILLKMLGLDWKHFWKISVNTCSVSIVEIQNGYTLVRCLNS